MRLWHRLFGHPKDKVGMIGGSVRTLQWVCVCGKKSLVYRLERGPLERPGREV